MDILYIPCLAFVLSVISASKAALILEKCTSNSDCPANSKCRPSGCDGYTCRCDVTFVYSDDRSQCIPGKLMGEECSGNLNKCLSPFAVCMDGICQCNELMEPTSDGRCKAPYEAELHHSCVEKFCVLSTDCVDDVCVCPEGKREITTDEYWLDPMKARKCVDKTYDVAYCEGQQLPLPIHPLKDDGIEGSENVVDGSWNRTDDTTDDNTDKQFPNKKLNNDDLVDSDTDREIEYPDSVLDEKTVNIDVNDNEDKYDSQIKLDKSETRGTFSTTEIPSLENDFANDMPNDIKSINDSIKLDLSVSGERKPTTEVYETFTTGVTLKAETGLRVGDSASSDSAFGPDNNGIEKVGTNFSTVMDEHHIENDETKDSETMVDKFLAPTQRTGINSSLSVNDDDQETVSGIKVNTASVTQIQPRLNMSIHSQEGIKTLYSFNMSKEFVDPNDTRIPYVHRVNEDPRNTTKLAMEDTNHVYNNVHFSIRQGAPLLSKFPDNMVNNGQFQKLVDGLFGYLLKGKRRVSIYYGCATDFQCPENAHCTRRGCNPHKQCLCREGFMPNVNGTHCIQDASRPCLLNEFTCSNARCIPLSWVCDGHDDCYHSEDESEKCTTVQLADDESVTTTRDGILRLHEKLSHEATMRMHLERNVQDLRDEISRLKDIYNSRTTKKEPSLENPPVDENSQRSRMVKDIFYEGFPDEIQTLLKMSEVYTLWGRSLCPRDSNTRTIYSGVMAIGSTDAQNNGDQGVICLPKVPEYNSSSENPHFNDHTKSISGFTYHLTCAVCQIQLASAVLTIPAKVTCPKDWRIEYIGTLVTSGGRDGGTSSHVCVEKSAIYNGGLKDSRSLGPDLYPVVVECGRIPCPPYRKNHVIPCVVCSV